MKIDIVYDIYSETIRQMPQNYFLASKTSNEWGECFYWTVQPDLAADPVAVCALSLAMLEYENKYSESPTAAIEKAKELYNKIQINI